MTGPITPSDYPLFSFLEHAVIRGPSVGERVIALAFVGHQYVESARPMLDYLAQRQLSGTFFLSRQFVDLRENQVILKRISDAQHQVGILCQDLPTHSDSTTEPAATIEKLRDKLTLCGFEREQIRCALLPNLQGAENWAFWLAEHGLVLVSPTPGIPTNNETIPNDAPDYVPAKQVYERVLARESETNDGLTGYIVCFQLGTHPTHTDKLHAYFPSLIDELIERNYMLISVNRLILPLLEEKNIIS